MVQSNKALVLALMRRLVADGSARSLREGARLSLSEVGRAVGTSPATIFRYENRQRVPHGETAMRYANFLAQLADLQLSAAQ